MYYFTVVLRTVEYHPYYSTVVTEFSTEFLNKDLKITR
jgi:hypothetical protein